MLIGIHGLATSGKTTVAKMLCESHSFHRVAFADPLKSMLNAIGIDRDNTHGDSKEVPLDILCGKTARHAMQTLGTDWGRAHIGDEFWVNVWESAYRRAKAVVPDVVTDDVRFPNEVRRIRELGGVVVKVKRPGVKQGSHASETHTLPYDYVIPNDGTVAELASTVANFMDILKDGR